MGAGGARGARTGGAGSAGSTRGAVSTRGAWGSRTPVGLAIFLEIMYGAVFVLVGTLILQ